jgi:hypothetical protein
VAAEGGGCFDRADGNGDRHAPALIPNPRTSTPANASLGKEQFTKQGRRDPAECDELSGELAACAVHDAAESAVACEALLARQAAGAVAIGKARMIAAANRSIIHRADIRRVATAFDLELRAAACITVWKIDPRVCIRRVLIARWRIRDARRLGQILLLRCAVAAAITRTRARGHRGKKGRPNGKGSTEN